MEEERGYVCAEWRHGQHTFWVVSYPRRQDRITRVQPSEEYMAHELLDLCRANSTLSKQGLKDLCRAKKHEIKKGAKQQQEDQCPTVAFPSSPQGRSSGVVIAGAGASLVAPLAVSDGGGALASPPLPPPALDSQSLPKLEHDGVLVAGEEPAALEPAGVPSDRNSCTSLAEVNDAQVTEAEAHTAAAEIIGGEPLKLFLASFPEALRARADNDSPTDLVQRCLDLYYDKITHRWKGNGMASYVPPGAARVEADVEKVLAQGDCLFEALSSKSEKHELRRRISDWERSNEHTMISIPCPTIPEGKVEDTVGNHAKIQQPTLSFEQYCDAIEKPCFEGGIWGEYLEAAAYCEESGKSVRIYVSDNGGTEGISCRRYARIGALDGSSHERDESISANTIHIVWGGAHFDRLVRVVEASAAPPVEADQSLASADGAGVEENEVVTEVHATRRYNKHLSCRHSTSQSFSQSVHQSVSQAVLQSLGRSVGRSQMVSALQAMRLAVGESGR